MKVFSFDPLDHRDTFAERGWVHVPGGLAPELLAELQDRLARSRARDALRGAGLAGAKAQHLFETDDMEGFCAQLFDAVSAVCGLDRQRMTLSERHLKVYDADAEPYPHAHKDRFASVISVGLSVDIPASSRLVLYPDVHREVNRFLTTEHRASLAPDDLPEVVLRDAPCVEIADRPGDVVMFYGSSMWHLRRHSAGAALLYLKFNDFDSDPLGEDPTTAGRRRRTLQALRHPPLPEGLVPVAARRLQSVTREYGRDWHEELWVTVFGGPRARISALELEVLRASDGTRTVASLARDLPGAEGALRRLAEIEAVDLLDRR